MIIYVYDGSSMNELKWFAIFKKELILLQQLKLDNDLARWSMLASQTLSVSFSSYQQQTAGWARLSDFLAKDQAKLIKIGQLSLLWSFKAERALTLGVPVYGVKTKQPEQW